MNQNSPEIETDSDTKAALQQQQQQTPRDAKTDIFVRSRRSYQSDPNRPSNHTNSQAARNSRLIGLKTSSTNGVGRNNAMTMLCAQLLTHLSKRLASVSSRCAKSSRVGMLSVSYQLVDSQLGCRPDVGVEEPLLLVLLLLVGRCFC